MIDLDKLEALEKAAMSAPWTTIDGGHLIIQRDGEAGIARMIATHRASPKQSALIVETRNALPALIAELRALRQSESECERELALCEKNIAIIDQILGGKGSVLNSIDTARKVAVELRALRAYRDLMNMAGAKTAHELNALRAVRDAAFAVHESICDYGYINQEHKSFAALSSAIDDAEAREKT